MAKDEQVMDEPGIRFPSWEPWRKRDSTFDPTYEVPRWFDMPGLYLLARFNKMESLSDSDKTHMHLNPNVIYIGASTKITQRLEGKKHATVNKKYIESYNDPKLNSLYFSVCHLEWKYFGTTGDIGKVKRAYLYYAERKLIWEYAKEYKRLPLLNQI